jgi:hypothetical protein
MGTYVSASARAQLDQAQADLERHLVTGLDGCCRSCGDLEPCRERGRLGAVFARYDELPRRRPGVTGVGVRRTIEGREERSWFASTPGSGTPSS